MKALQTWLGTTGTRRIKIGARAGIWRVRLIHERGMSGERGATGASHESLEDAANLALAAWHEQWGSK